MLNLKQLTREQLSQVDRPEIEYGPDLVEVEGFVAEGGTGYEHAGGYHVHLFQFAAWRRAGIPGRSTIEPIVERTLTILRPTSLPAKDCFEDIPKLSLQRFQVLLSIDETRAILAAPGTEPPHSSGLREFAEERAKPVIIDHTQFGKLVLDRRIDYFAGRATWNGEEVNISFESEPGHDISRALGVAETLWKDQAAWQQKVEDLAVQTELPTKNEHWLDSDEECDSDEDDEPIPLTPAQFKQRMTLETIQINSRGEFEFWFNDGGMFYGHSILVCGKLDGLKSASMQG
jgi:hypothetical protein